MSKKKRHQNNLIAQSRPLVEARYNFTLWELRIFVEILQQITREDDYLKVYKIFYKDFVSQYGKGGKDYEHLRNASISILRKIAHFNYISPDGEERVYHAVLFTSASTPKDWKEKDVEKYIEFKVNPDLKDQLIQLKKNYLLYDKRNILKLRSKFAVRIYQILKSYERKDKDIVIVTLSIKELRETLLVDDKGEPTQQYTVYTVFKQRVIMKAQSELKEHTDIAFTFEEIKKGRKVDAIKFFIKKNRKVSKSNPIQLDEIEEIEELEELEELESEQSEVITALLNLGISPEAAYSFDRKYRNKEELLLNELRFAKKELGNAYNVKSETGFIIASIKARSYEKAELFRKKLQEKSRSKKNSQKKMAKSEQEKIEALRQEYTTKRNDAVKGMLEGKSKKEVNILVEGCLEGKSFVSRAIEKAEKDGKMDEVYEFKYGLLAKSFLTDDGLNDFETYLRVHHNLILDDSGKHQLLRKMDVL